MLRATAIPLDTGLTSEEARRRLGQFGPNALSAQASSRPWHDVLRAFADPMVVLLAAVASIHLALGETADGVFVLLAVAPLVAMDIALEVRGRRALRALEALVQPRVRVLRDGHWTDVDAVTLVPGDRIELQEGDRVAADGEVLSSEDLALDESVLTGESHPVRKQAGDGAEIFAGSVVVSGRAQAEVTRTGSRTQFGRISELAEAATRIRTPLQDRIGAFVSRLAVLAIAICVALVLILRWTGHGWSESVLAGLTFAMAAMPEEFPVVYGLFLALGAYRLARRRVLCRDLTAVETLGSATVVCVDKTGTLTTGRLRLSRAVTAQSDWQPGTAAAPDIAELLEAALLASEEHPFDPVDQAVELSSGQAGLRPDTSRGRRTIQRQYPFDPVLKHHTHVWREAGGLRTYSKGSPETLIRLSGGATPERIADALRRVDATRWLAVAAGPAGDGEEADRLLDEQNLQLIGLIGFEDPLRPESRTAVERCRNAGVRVVMITGDRAITARSIAEQAGIGGDRPRVSADETGHDVEAAEFLRLCRETDVFARATPELKHRIVTALIGSGEVVAMTGDGVNDAPALKAAHIGIAMGRRGTEVARYAARLVLLDDDFAAFVEAMAEGRRIFDDIREAFAYLITFHVPVFVLALLAPIAGLPLILLTPQIVWLELIVHPTVSLAFPIRERAADILQRKPRPRDSGILPASGVIRSLAAGLIISAAALGAFVWFRSDPDMGRSSVMIALCCAFAAFVLSVLSAWRKPLILAIGVLTAISPLPVLAWPALRQATHLGALAPLPAFGSILLGAASGTVAAFVATRLRRTDDR